MGSQQPQMAKPQMATLRAVAQDLSYRCRVRTRQEVNRVKGASRRRPVYPYVALVVRLFQMNHSLF